MYDGRVLMDGSSPAKKTSLLRGTLILLIGYSLIRCSLPVRGVGYVMVRSYFSQLGNDSSITFFHLNAMIARLIIFRLVWLRGCKLLYGLQEHLRVGVQRVCDHGLCRSYLDQLAPEHHRDAVAKVAG